MVYINTSQTLLLKRKTSPIWLRQKNAKDVSDVDVQSNKTQQKSIASMLQSTTKNMVGNNGNTYYCHIIVLKGRLYLYYNTSQKNQNNSIMAEQKIRKPKSHAKSLKVITGDKTIKEKHQLKLFLR